MQKMIIEVKLVVTSEEDEFDTEEEIEKSARSLVEDKDFDEADVKITLPSGKIIKLKKEAKTDENNQ